MPAAAVLAVAVSLGAAPCSAASASEGAPLRLAASIPLKGVTGRLDHMAADVGGRRIFVAGTDAGTVEVVDVQQELHVGTIRGLKEPQGLLYLAPLKRLFASNGGSGELSIFDASTFAQVGSVSFASDADNLRAGPRGRRIYAAWGRGALGVVEAESGRSLATLALGAHPEGFELDRAGERAYVNLADGRIAVLEVATGRVVATWKAKGMSGNYPLALDEAAGRLFIGYRRPSAVGVLDASDGRLVARLEAPADADDLFYDGERGRVYVTGGGGKLFVIERVAGDRFRIAARLSTGRGARTSLWVPGWSRLAVAVPARGGRPAEVRLYAPGP